MPNKAMLIAILFLSPGYLFSQKSDGREDHSIFREKIFVRTDKSNYMAGEMLWWKLYYTDAYLRRPASLSRIAYLEIIDPAGKPVLQAKSALGKGGSNGVFFLPPSVSSGVYTLRAYTNWMKNFGPDYFFSKQIAIINALHPAGVSVSGQDSAANDNSGGPHQLTVSLAGCDKKYPSRKEVILMVHTATSNGSVPATVSVAVYKVDSSSGATGNLKKYLWATPAQNTDVIKYPPEVDGQIITGDLKTSSGKPVANMVINLSVPAAHGAFYPALTDSIGRFSFDVRNYYGPGRIILKTADDERIDYHFTVTDPFFDVSGRNEKNIPTASHDSLSASATREAVDMQVQNIYHSQELGKSYLPDVDTLPFYGNHYVNYNLDDYVRFITVEEVLREYIPQVAVRRINGQLELSVIDYLHKGYFIVKPLILLDGVAVSAKEILSYDPLKIKNLKVVTANYHLGEFIYGGVVSFSTYQSAAEDIPATAKTTAFDYDGLQPVP
ncbi:MAG: hypothetical protein H0X41_12330, partial [Chitinophagaceae bacterium]|nr:hypothetical protein [Chitinophagaceae bacterium]